MGMTYNRPGTTLNDSLRAVLASRRFKGKQNSSIARYDCEMAMSLACAILASMLAAAAPQDTSVTVPLIKGTVVDAISGKPIAGVDVILRAKLLVASFGDGGAEPLRYENVRTSSDGRFLFPAKAEPRASNPLASIAELSLSVNRVYYSVEQMRAIHPSETWRTSDDGSDVWWLVEHGTLDESNTPTRLTDRDISLGALNKKAYFPVSVQFLRDCDEAFSCLSLPLGKDNRIALIPVLNDVSECKQIADWDSGERCSRVNGYRSAMLHVENVEQIRAGKALCRSLDNLSAQCLQQLHGEVKAHSQAGPPESFVMPPAEMVLIGSIAGFSASRIGRPRFEAFEEAAVYEVSYTPETGPQFPINVAVSVGSREPSSDDVSIRMVAADPIWIAGREQRGLFEGFPVTMRPDGGPTATAAWSSANKIVCIKFSNMHLAGGGELSVEQRRALIRAYIQKYPPAK